MGTPLKLKDANGNIQEMTTSEENFIAYKIGLGLYSDTSGPGSLNTSSGNSVGSFVDTFFNEPVGTAPSTSISSGSTTTNVYQTGGSATEGSYFPRPIEWVNDPGFKEMTNTSLNAAIDRYLSTIFTNDYPGTYKLASSSPGGDYSVALSNVFTDTRTDGNSTNYSIYKRQSYTAPSTIRPLKIKYDAGNFDGVHPMLDSDITASLIPRAKTRIVASGIGTYQLRTSTQGVPTDTGTWVSKGSAVDTVQQTADVAYTRTSTNQFQTSYTNNFEAAYTTNFTNISQLNYTNTYTGPVYTNSYTNAYELIDTESFSVPYAINYSRAFDTPYTSTYVGTYTGGYQKAFATQYEAAYEGATYTGTFETTYTGTYTGNYATVYQSRPFQVNYAGNVNYTANINYNIDPNYARNYEANINYQRAYTRNINYQRAYTRNINYNRVFNYNAGYAGGYAANYDGIANNNESLEAQRRNSNGFSNKVFFSFAVYTRNFSGRARNYTGNVSGYTRSYVRNFVRNFVRAFTRNINYNRVFNYTINYNRVFNYTVDYNINPTYQRNYVANINYEGNPVYNKVTDYLREGPLVDYQRNYVANSEINYVGTFETAYVPNYLTDYQSNYQSNYERAFDGAGYDKAYTNTYTGAYEQVYTGQYTGTYTSNYERVYDKAYTGNYDTDYQTDYTGNYQNEYINAYQNEYATDYEANYVGDFAGQTILASNENNETYTLYVRVS